ncbi:MAG TPA: hypothetical protein VNA24_24165 [Hyalangium sp.]|nr:hypothetical protein [Hyalangium sp.]
MKPFSKQLRSLCGALLCGATLLVAGQSQAALLINVDTAGCTTNMAINNAIAQSFRVDSQTQLDKIEMWIKPELYYTTSYAMELYSGEGTGGTKIATSPTTLTLGSQTAGTPSGFYAFPFPNLTLQPNQPYTFKLVRLSTYSGAFSWCGNVYPHGNEYWLGYHADPHNDLSFRVYSVQPLVYGQTYRIQNSYQNWQGGFLDTRAAGCEGNFLCVSTAAVPNRESNSGTWKLLSASGKPAGTPVSPGDDVHLQNMHAGFGGYLDVAYGGCDGNFFCVSTAFSSNRDQGSGTWKVLPNGSTSGSIMEGQPLHLLNGYASYNVGFLDIMGTGCEGNLYCTSTSLRWDRDGVGTASWRFFAQ